jgi:hypothetical protein
MGLAALRRLGSLQIKHLAAAHIQNARHAGGCWIGQGENPFAEDQ